MELPINLLVILSIAVIVLIAGIAVFMGVWNPFSGAQVQGANFRQQCSLWANSGCSGSTPAKVCKYACGVVPNIEPATAANCGIVADPASTTGDCTSIKYTGTDSTKDRVIRQSCGCPGTAPVWIDNFQWSAMKIQVDQEKCIGCGTCSSTCPVSLYEVVKKKSGIRSDALKSSKKEGSKLIFFTDECIGCRACEVQCPEGAIVVSDEWKLSEISELLISIILFKKATTTNFMSKKLQKIAYVLGALFGDGCFYKNKNNVRIIFSVTDRDFIEKVSENIRDTFI
jgi:ferredoxin